MISAMKLYHVQRVIRDGFDLVEAIRLIRSSSVGATLISFPW